MKKAILLGLILPIISIAQQDKIWSLQDCIDHALRNNIQLKQQQLQTELAEQDYIRNKGSVLPNLNAGVGNTFYFGRTIDPFTNEFISETQRSNNFFLSSNMNLFNGFVNKNSIEKSSLDLKSANEDLEKSKNDIVLALSNAYLQVLLSLELLEVAQQQTEITKLQISRIKKLVEVGSLPKGNLLTIEAQLATEELQVVNTKGRLQMSYLNLAQLLDIDDIKSFKIVKPKLSVPDKGLLELDPNEVISLAMGNRPEIKSARYKVESADKSIEIAKGNYLPSLSLSGTVGTGYSTSRMKPGDQITLTDIPAGRTESGELVYVTQPSFNYVPISFSEQFEDNVNPTVSLNLSIPIFNRYQIRTAVAQSEIMRQNADLTLQGIENQVAQVIQQAYYDATTAYNKHQASEKSVEALKQSFEYTEKRFNVGMVNSVEYNEAKNNYTKAKSDLLQAKYEYIFTLKILEFYKSNQLKF